MSNPLKAIIPGTRYATVPQQSPEEAALLREQADLLRQQRSLLDRQLREQDLLTGFAFQEAGYRAVRDDKGNITGYEQIPEGELPEDQRQSRQIEDLFRQRSLAALRGELPVNPALTRSLAEDKANLEERLRRELGPGFATSTPGMQALSDQELRQNELLEGARRGDLTLAEQLGQARTSANIQTSGADIGTLFGLAGRTSPQISMGTGLAGAYSAPVSSYLNSRALAANVDVANMQQWLNRRMAVANTFSNIFRSAFGGK